MKIKRKNGLEYWESFKQRFVVIRAKYGTRYTRYFSSNLIFVPGCRAAKNFPCPHREAIARLMARWYSMHHPHTDVYVDFPGGRKCYRLGVEINPCA